jgi:hypothetical protein
MMKAGQGQGRLLIDAPGGEDASSVLIQALFEEARRRCRRRRLAYAAISLILVVAVAVGLTTGWPPGGAAPAGQRHAPLAGAGEPAFTLPAATVAWVDYQGQLHVGDVATRVQGVVASVPALAGIGRLLQADGRLYAAGAGVIRQFNIATGAVRQVARGDGIFASADGQHLYITRGSGGLFELPADGSGDLRQLSIPAGWYLDPPDQAVAGGIVVVGPHPADQPGRRSILAIWNPGTGSVKIVSSGGSTVLAAYTPRGARFSLLAWQAAGCLTGNCPIDITNTSSMTTVTVRSPLRHGFTIPGAAFSPDGTQLAVFARTASLSPFRANRSDLGLVSTSAGSVRLVPGAQLDTTEDAGWAVWLPGGTRLLAGALDFSYAVDANTRAARPFFFFPGGADHDIMDTPDLNFSSVLLPGRR